MTCMPSILKICFVLRDFEKWDARTDNTCNIAITTGRVWVDLVDQKAKIAMLD